MGLFNSRGGAAKGPALFQADVVAISGVIQPRTRKRLYWVAVTSQKSPFVGSCCISVGSCCHTVLGKAEAIRGREICATP